MRALSVTQPFATLIGIGAKRYETRSWGTIYRGPLGIHASKRFPKWAQVLCNEEPFSSVLHHHGLVLRELPTGVVIATCRLVDCRRIDGRWNVVGDDVSFRERQFGDWREDGYAWKLVDVIMLPEPVPAKGALGLWWWTP